MPTPDLSTVLSFAADLGLPTPVEDRPVYDTWFMALHEIGHHAIVPGWYRDYAKVIEYDPKPKDAPCAPPVPYLWLLEDPTPNELCVRLWVMQVCEYFGWDNPLILNPSIFGGRGYKPEQWYMSPKDLSLSGYLLKKFGVDVGGGVFLSQEQNINLPYPEGKTLWEILENHDHIYNHYGVDMHVDLYSEAHIVFLKHVSNQIRSVSF